MYNQPKVRRLPERLQSGRTSHAFPSIGFEDLLTYRKQVQG
jgi:hypothetical protein